MVWKYSVLQQTHMSHIEIFLVHGRIKLMNDINQHFWGKQFSQLTSPNRLCNAVRNMKALLYEGNGIYYERPAVVIFPR